MREGNVVVIEGWSFDKPKTKEFVESLSGLGLDGKTLIVDSFDNENLFLSARNLQRAKVVNSSGLNIYDLLYHEKLVLSQAAVEELEQLLGPKQAAGTATEEVEAGDEEPKAKKKPAKAAPKRERKPKKEAA